MFELVMVARERQDWRLESPKTFNLCFTFGKRRRELKKKNKWKNSKDRAPCSFQEKRQSIANLRYCWSLLSKSHIWLQHKTLNYILVFVELSWVWIFDGNKKMWWSGSGLDELFLNLEETKVGVSKIPIFYLIYRIRAPNNFLTKTCILMII